MPPCSVHVVYLAVPESSVFRSGTPALAFSAIPWRPESQQLILQFRMPKSRQRTRFWQTRIRLPAEKHAVNRRVVSSPRPGSLLALARHRVAAVGEPLEIEPGQRDRPAAIRLVEAQDRVIAKARPRPPGGARPEPPLPSPRARSSVAWFSPRREFAAPRFRRGPLPQQRALDRWPAELAVNAVAPRPDADQHLAAEDDRGLRLPSTAGDAGELGRPARPIGDLAPVILEQTARTGSFPGHHAAANCRQDADGRRD